MPTAAAKVKSKRDPSPARKAKRVDFTNLEKLIFRQAQVNKRHVLEYYNDVADYALPYLKDRPLWTRLNPGDPVAVSVETLFQNDSRLIPEWIRTAKGSADSELVKLLVCNDREHLLLGVENGCVEFRPGPFKIKQFGLPEYLLIAVDSPQSELGPAIEVSHTIREILNALQLPSFVKTDAVSGLHIYVPLDSKGEIEVTRKAAENICKLVRIKVPDQVSLKGSGGYVHGRVSLDYSLNRESGGTIAPYSLAVGDSPVVATPLLWNEVNDGLRTEEFNHQTIRTRLKQVGDPFAGMFKKKVNADSLLQRLEDNYSFLF